MNIDRNRTTARGPRGARGAKMHGAKVVQETGSMAGEASPGGEKRSVAERSRRSRVRAASPDALLGETGRLVHLARENPFQFFTLADAAKICGFGVNIMTALGAAGAPIIGRRCNPQLLLQWLGRNAHRMGKVREL